MARSAVGKVVAKFNFPKPQKILVIPDMQIKPNIDLRFVYAIGRYILDKRPDIVINLGDMADMPSLSSYDKGKKSHEGKRYLNDVESVITAQKVLFDPINAYNDSLPKSRKAEIYNPLTIFLEGNHEKRIDTATELNAVLDGSLDLRKDLKLDDYWDKVFEFLQVVTVQGIAFSHYFTTGVMGKAAGTAQAQLKKVHMSCIAGHQPGRQTFTEKAADGRLLTSMIIGSSYDYNLDYMGVQGNKHWRGIVMLHSAIDGEFDEVYVPTKYLMQKYTKDMGPLMYSPKRRANER